MSDADPAGDGDAACLAAVCGTGPVPAVNGEKVHILRMHTAAIRALAARSAPSCDGLHLVDVQRYRAEPGDVIVAYLPSLASSEVRERVKAELVRVFASNAVLVSCDVGLEVIQQRKEATCVEAKE